MVQREENRMILTFEEDTFRTAEPDLLQVADGKVPFFITDDWTEEERTVLRSGRINTNAVSEMTLTIQMETEGSMTVRYIMESETNYDFFRIVMDGSEVFRDSGEKSEFAEQAVTLKAGVHVILLRYTTDGSNNKGKDGVGISRIEFVGVEMAYEIRFLMTDFNGKVYTLEEGNVTEVPGISEKDLISGMVFQEYGFEKKPTSTQILSITKPKIYRWADGEPKPMTAVIKAVPKAQIVSGIADLTDPTIKGIKLMTAVYSGEVMAAYSYDGNDYTEMTMEELLSLDVKMLYRQAKDRIYFRFTIPDDTASLTNFIISYVNS